MKSDFSKTIMAQVFTDDNFQEEVLESELPVLVDFWATWCGPCQMMTPVIEALAQELDGKMKVGKLNVDENPNVSQQYGIMGIPAFKIFKNGEVLEEFSGAMPKESLQSRLEAYL